MSETRPEIISVLSSKMNSDLESLENDVKVAGDQ